MTSEQMYRLIGEIGESKIMEAESFMKKNSRNYWIKLGTVAACLCVLIGGIVFSRINKPDNWEIDETIDPIVGDMAVFPENESIENVADATVNILSDEEVYDVDKLSEYLPNIVVSGYRFGSAGIYKTTMKDGTEYFRLRVNYSFTDGASDSLYEEEIMMLDYSVSVMNYKPKTENPFFTVETLNLIPTVYAPNYTFIIELDGLYIEVVSGDLTYDELMSVLTSIH